MNIDKSINKILITSKNKGASIKLQNQWKSFTPKIKNQMRMKFKDSDGDRIPDKWDCQPLNVMRQDFGNINIAHLSEEQQINLFKQNKKPTIITTYDLPEYKRINIGPSWTEYDDKNGKIVRHGPSNYLYYTDKTKKEATNIINTIKKKKYTINYHIILGKNLGYSRNEVYNFIQKLPEYKNSSSQQKQIWYNMIFK